MLAYAPDRRLVGQGASKLLLPLLAPQLRTVAFSPTDILALQPRAALAIVQPFCYDGNGRLWKWSDRRAADQGASVHYRWRGDNCHTEPSDARQRRAESGAPLRLAEALLLPPLARC